MSVYTLINSHTVPSDVASVTLSSIPQTYTDLWVVIVGQSTYAGDAGNGCRIRLNGDSTAGNYAMVDMRAGGAAPIGIDSSSASYMEFVYLPSSGGGTAVGNLGCSVIEFQDYTNTHSYKAALGRSFSQNSYIGITQAIRKSAQAITSIQWFGDGNIKAGSTIYLYGLLGA